MKHPAVTIFFSDIEGFTVISSKVPALRVMKMLHELYSVMDYCACLFPTYKVETIGDAYMLVGVISAIVKNLMKRDKLRLLTVESILAIAPSLISPLTALIGNEYNDKFLLSEILNKIVKLVTKSPHKNVASLQFILELMTNLQNPIEGIIFDEANKYFIKNSLPLLDVLTFLTKQKRQLAVIMATSDYGFPFALENIGYNTFHISKSLVLSDVSPCDTLRLLSSWGVRPNLAYLLVELYGGHVLKISRALIDLYIKKENANINTYFISGLKNQLAVCMKESEDAGICEEVMIALDKLMSTGFYACNFNDPVAELLTNVI